VFSNDTQAAAANQSLLRLGLTEDEIEVGEPRPGRYRIDTDEAAELGRGAAIGIAVGVVVGGIIGVAAMNVIMPGILYTGGMTAISLGFLIGAFWGIFFGGLGGVVPKVLAYEHGPAIYEIPSGGAHTVVVAHANGLAGDARKVMMQGGVRAILADAPVLHPVAPAEGVHVAA
jgi:hypothetical protein